MPYIKQEDREKFVVSTRDFSPACRVDLIREIGEEIENAGDFNYVVTKLAHKYIETQGERYQFYNDLLGALEGIKLELYRKQVAPYEDIKEKENPL